MSKTTKRLGKPLYTMTFSCEANPKPSANVAAQWAALDKAALATFGRPYDALNSREKGEIHFQLNVAREAEAAQRKAAKKKQSK